MCNSGFNRSDKDQCCYLKKISNSYVMLLLYVDDVLTAGSNLKEINKLKKELSKEFEMKDLGPAKQIIGMIISRDRFKGTLRLSQEHYVHKILDHFRIGNATSRTTPLENHLKLSKEQSPMTTEEWDYMSKVPYASAVAKFMDNPSKARWEAMKWLLR